MVQRESMLTLLMENPSGGLSGASSNGKRPKGCEQGFLLYEKKSNLAVNRAGFFRLIFVLVPHYQDDPGSISTSPSPVAACAGVVAPEKT